MVIKQLYFYSMTGLKRRSHSDEITINIREVEMDKLIEDTTPIRKLLATEYLILSQVVIMQRSALGLFYKNYLDSLNTRCTEVYGVNS